MSSKTTVQPTPPSEEERALQAQQLKLAEFQLEELQRQSTLQQEFAGQIQPLLDIQAEEAQRALEQAEKFGPIQEELLTLALEDLRRGGAATPEQISLIEEAGAAAIARGETDIERFRGEGLEVLREELAPSLGLRPSDTPILDRGSRLAAEAARQQGQLVQGVRGAEATARLNFPLAQSQLLQASAFGQQSLAEAARQFQDNLRQQAFTNRLNLQSTVGGLGLGLATGVSVPFPGFQRGSTTSTSDPLGGFTSILGGAGGFLSGLGAVGAFGSTAAPAAAVFAAPLPFLSSRDAKTDKLPVDEDAVLEGVSRLPVESWRYKEGLGLASEKRHVGPFAEDFKNSFGLGDGKTIDMVDTAGILLASVKALSKKVKKLETLGLANDNSLGLARDYDERKRENGGLGLAANAAGSRDRRTSGGFGLRVA